ncbi:hypothetical protein C0585_05495 [Candidatus Woesearchaeota archaeon]|nr:MAG: hypothetical protein C0585_05495 [Candidatus Woesearchaeota archaeon]
MDNYYDEISEGYEELHREEQEKKIAFIKVRLNEYFNIEKSHSLLDVGCGTGITTIPWNCKRTGLDPAIKLLEKGNKKDEIDYVLGAAEDIPFKDNSFDIITSITAIQNFEDLEKGLSEIRRVGKDFFILSYLKASQKGKIIEEIINRLFDVKLRFEEDKDIIFFCSK